MSLLNDYLIVFGAVVSALGLVFQGQKDFPNFYLKLTRGLVSSFLGGLLGFVTLVGMLAPAWLLIAVTRSIGIRVGTDAEIDRYWQWSISTAYSALGFGLLIGFLAGFARIGRTKAGWKTRNNLFLFIGSIILICTLIALFYTVGQAHPRLVSLIDIATIIYGFVLGALVDTGTYSRNKFIAILLALFVVVVAVFRWLGGFPDLVQQVSVSLTVESMLAISSLCGYLFCNRALYGQNPSYKRFLVWLVIATMTGIVLSMVMNLAQATTLGLTFFVVAIALFIALGKGEAKKLLNSPKHPTRMTAQGQTSDATNVVPIFDRPIAIRRFLNSCSVSFLYTLLLWFLLVGNIVFNNLDPGVALLYERYGRISIWFSIIPLILLFSVPCSLIVGFAYTFGYIIVSKAERLVKNYVTLIGYSLVYVGIFISAAQPAISILKANLNGP